MEKIRPISRRNALKLTSATVISAALAACGPDATPTPTATPTRPARKTPTPGIEIRNGTGKDRIIIPTETLDFLETQIKDSGLPGKIKSVIIVDMNNPILNTDYPEESLTSELLRPNAKTVPSADPKEGVTIYLANILLSKRDIAYELGNAANPNINKAVDMTLIEFNNDYFTNHYLSYLRHLRPYSTTLEPYFFSHEKQIVMYASNVMGEKYWDEFSSVFTSLPTGSTQWFIPDGKLQTLADRLPPNSIQKEAVLWRMSELARLKLEGKKPETQGFDYETWGLYLLRRYHEDPYSLEKAIPDSFPEIKRIATQSWSLALFEVWADLWAERVLNPDNARKLYPLGVQTQEQVISFLKKK